MKQMITLFKPLSIIAIAVTFWGCSAQRQPRHLAPDWVMGGFVRPAGVNPVIEPDSTTTFMNPMNGQLVHWENNDTFNPAAVVKGDSIYVLYRAEDKTGIKIGHRTSSLGLAASAD